MSETRISRLVKGGLWPGTIAHRWLICIVYAIAVSSDVVERVGGDWPPVAKAVALAALAVALTLYARGIFRDYRAGL